MDERFGIVQTDQETRAWFMSLPEEIAEATAALAALRAFFVSLVVSTRQPNMDLYHWRHTHEECQMALMLVMKALLPFRGQIDGTPARLQTVDLGKISWTLAVAGQFARASLENALGRSRDDWYEAIRFSAVSLSRETKSTGDEIAHPDFSATWLRTVAHAREDAEDLRANDLKTVLSSALFAEDWLLGDLELYFKFGIAKHAGEPIEGPRFEFWRRWYKGFLFGKPLDWSVMQEIAALPSDIWFGEHGLTALPVAIREIEARHAGEVARINETLVLNEDSHKYRAEHPETSNADRLRRHLSRVEEALDDILALGGGNGVTANTVEFRIIKRLVSKYSDDPERISFDLTDVNKSIRRQVKVGEYADDEPLKLLQAANTACISFICDTEPDIARELDRSFDPEPQAVTEADVLRLEAAWRISEDMLEPDAALTTREDWAEILAGQVIDAEVDPMPEWCAQAHAMRSIVLRRQISRLWQQAQGLMTVKRLAELYDADHSKAAGYVGRVGGAAGTLIAAILILAAMLGLS